MSRTTVGKTILPVGRKNERSSLGDAADMEAKVKQQDAGPSIPKRRSMPSQGDSYFKMIDCKCAPRFYNFMGPTADEILLKGLQTVVNIFGKFTKCGEKTETLTEEPEENKTVPNVVTEVLESLGLPPEMVSKIIQTSFAELEEEKPELANKILQTSTPEMISRILSTVGLEPEMITEIIQTLSFQSEKPSLKSEDMQTSSPSMIEVSMQTSDFNVETAKNETEVEKEEVKTDNSADEDNLSTSKHTCDVTEKIDEGVKSRDREERMCICCDCHRTNEEEMDEKRRTSCASPRRLCRCYECSSPVAFRIRRRKDACICSTPGVRCGNCKKKGRSPNGTRTAFAKGDTCSLLETPCACEKRKTYFCFRD